MYLSIFFGVVSCIFFALIMSKQKKMDAASRARDKDIREKLERILDKQAP